MAKRVCKGSHEAEDVAHYVIESFINNKKAEGLIERGEAMKFMSGMMHLSFYSSTSPYHRIFRQKGRMKELYPETAEMLVDEEYDTQGDMALEAVQGMLEEMLAEGVEQWFRATLFQMWTIQPNYSELARKTGIPRTSISQAVNECITYIKEELKERGIYYDL